MAKVKLGNLDPRAFATVRGVLLLRDTRWGPIVQKWPRKRGKYKTPYDFYRQTEFGIAARDASNPEPLSFQTAIEMAKGTEQVPRDILMMAAYGRYYVIMEEDGTIWENGRDMTNNPQYVLDLIGNTVGSIIYRAEVGWVLLPPGNDAQVLVSMAQVPQWVDSNLFVDEAAFQALLDGIGATEGDILFRGPTEWVAINLNDPEVISSILDVIDNTEGAIFRRGADAWEGLAPGDDFQVLTLIDGLPEWVDPQYVPPPTPTPADLALLYAAFINHASATATFNNVSFGPSDPARVIVAGIVTARSTAAGARSINSVTMNGASMTAIGSEIQIGSQITLNLFYRPDAEQSSGTIVANLSGANQFTMLVAWSMRGLQNSAPTDTMSASGSNPSGTIDNLAGGVLIALAAAVGGTAVALSWTGPSVDAGFTLQASNRGEGASLSQLAATTGRTVGVTSAMTTEAVMAATWS